MWPVNQFLQHSEFRIASSRRGSKLKGRKRDRQMELWRERKRERKTGRKRDREGVFCV